MTTMEAARAAKQRYSGQLLSEPGVAGVGVERRSGDWVVVVHADPAAQDTVRVPRQLDGVPVVLVWDGPFQALR
ncbi:hypothetical protein [Actinoplanes sp. L3-i22]|uniref:hypothetical protein n=1 Tax=Actinoplanes sp. L3-i22 TaxID=2836373 RepID=UPI001C78F148|nr:hypothetical protein [Actinoplanes sp. L3-i22]BCY09665.1 hypothetical protein L3i22_047530 [Actinoplanes sp. L3-i22]